MDGIEEDDGADGKQCLKPENYVETNIKLLVLFKDLATWLFKMCNRFGY